MRGKAWKCRYRDIKERQRGMELRESSSKKHQRAANTTLTTLHLLLPPFSFNTNPLPPLLLAKERGRTTCISKKCRLHHPRTSWWLPLALKSLLLFLVQAVLHFFRCRSILYENNTTLVCAWNSWFSSGVSPGRLP